MAPVVSDQVVDSEGKHPECSPWYQPSHNGNLKFPADIAGPGFPYPEP